MKKTEEKIKKAQQKLEQIKEEFEQKSELLKSFIKKRAGLLADFEIESDKKVKKEIDGMTTKIDELKFYKEGKPELITALQAKIEELNLTISKEKGVARGLEQAKKIEKIKAMSQKFYKDLQNIKILNDELGEEWHRLHEAGMNIGNKGVCTGSKDGLRTLLEVTAAEMNGQGRKPILFGSIPNFKI